MRIKLLAISMVAHWLEGKKIRAIGDNVHIFPGGESIMNTTDAYECCSWLYEHGIIMKRLDSGGAPQWGFEIRQSK